MVLESKAIKSFRGILFFNSFGGLGSSVVERFLGKEEVGSSILLLGSNSK